MLTTVLLVLLIVVLIGGLPQWGYHAYGPYPSGLAFALILVVVGLLLIGRL